tara:strand:- start:403 stop:864 length:462 start_codon:yes stop_codon:yes gene_type:complete
MTIETKIVLIEELTYSGSAFGVLPENGEGVFINQRIVEKMNLEPDTEVYASVLPNYSDKRSTIPWRVVNVVATDPNPTEENGPTDAQIEDMEIDARIEDEEEIDALVLDLLGQKPQTIKDIYDSLDWSLPQIRSSLQRQKELVRKVEVYRLAD